MDSIWTGQLEGVFETNDVGNILHFALLLLPLDGLEYLDLECVVSRSVAVRGQDLECDDGVLPARMLAR